MALTFKFKPPRIPLFWLRGEDDFRQLGEVVIRTNMDRAMLAINSNDVQAAPLTEGYARRKKRRGLPAIRNLQLDGYMWGAVALTELSEEHATVAFSDGLQQIKANKNNLIDPFFGVSPSDDDKISEKAQQLVDEKVADFNNG